MRVLVCGGRDYGDQGRLFYVLDYYHASHPFGVVIHGAADGADFLASVWAQSRGIEPLPYPAVWDDLTTPPVRIRHRRDGTPYNAAAGGIRNERMLREGRPEIVIAFPGGNGTADMIDRAERALGRERVLRIDQNA